MISATIVIVKKTVSSREKAGSCISLFVLRTGKPPDSRGPQNFHSFFLSVLSHFLHFLFLSIFAFKLARRRSAPRVPRLLGEDSE